MLNSIRTAGFVTILLACMSPAMAHPGHAGFGDLSSGLMHPMTGLDHLVTILACGALAAALAGPVICRLPLLFAVSMLLGGILGVLGAWTASAEYALMLSVPAVCLLLVAQRRAGFQLAAAIVLGTGLLHGASHGAELPTGASPVAFFAGFLISTLLLLAIGLMLSLAVSHIYRASDQVPSQSKR